MLLVRCFEHTHCARHTDRAATDNAFVKRKGLTIFHEQVFIHASRRSFAAIKGLSLFTIMVQEERAAANAAGLWFDQAKHELHCNRRINRATACFEHLVARIGGEWVGRCDCEFRGGPARLLGDARCALGLLEWLVGEIGGGASAGGK